ncbi:MAG TPA: FkbM family methyltransferase [Dongiaceae bacterium]|jgi:FkbM family methyltransferase
MTGPNTPGGVERGLFRALRRIGLGNHEEPATGPDGGPAKTAIMTLPSTQAARAAAHAGPNNADRHNFAFMERYLHVGDAMLDIGANAGVYAIAAAKVVGLAGRVDAVEPSPTMRAKLTEAVTAAGVKATVVINPVMVGNKDGLGRYADGTTKSGRRRSPAAGELAMRVVGVESVRLDQLLSKRPYAMLHMDIAGCELTALQGGREHLAKCHPPVLMLAMDDALRDFGSTPAALIDWLDELGYEIAFYDADRNVIEYPDIPWQRRRKLLAIARKERNTVLRRLADQPAPPARANGAGHKA